MSLPKSLRLFLAALFFVSNAAYADFTNWSWTVPSGETGSWRGTESGTGIQAYGDLTRLSSGFLRLVVTNSFGVDAPAIGTIKYALEAPGFSLFVQPTLANENKPIQSTISGECPLADWTGNFVFTQWPGSGYNMTSFTPAFGNFTWSPSNNTVTLNNVYMLKNITSLATNVPISGSCSDGVITLTGSGDRSGKIYVSYSAGAVYNVNTGALSKSVYAVPALAFPATGGLMFLTGNYAATSYDNSPSPTIKHYKAVISATDVQFQELTDIDNNVADPANGWIIYSPVPNNPAPGLFSGRLKKKTNGVETSFASNDEVICQVYLSSKNTITCLGHDNGTNDALPRSFTLVSLGQSIASGQEDNYTIPVGYNGAVTSTSGTDRMGALKFLSDGRMYVTGWTTNPKRQHVSRLLPDGTIDTSFGYRTITYADGVHGTTSPGIGPDLAVQTDGKVVVAGFAKGTGTGGYDLALSRFLTDGNLDTTFGSGGKALIQVSAGRDDQGYRIALTGREGRILMTGWSYFTGSFISDHILVRLTSTGALDTTFNSGGTKKGVASFKVQSGNNAGNAVFVTNVSGAEKYITVGHAWVLLGKASFTAARWNTNGTLDTAFGTNGIFNGSFGNGNCQAWSGAIQPDRKVILAGYANTGTKNDFAVMRLLQNGQLDTTFNGTGKVTTAVGTVTTHGDQIYSVAIQADGKIVVAGDSAYDATKNKVALVRYNSDGSIDTTFASGGKSSSELGTTNFVADMAIQSSDGKIVVLSQSLLGTSNYYLIKRYWP